MMKIDKNIVLIGFMGVGKGTIARALAEKLGVFAIDCDDLIESAANKKIRAIFDEDGEERFRKIEATLAKFLEKSVAGAIISTGGGFYKVKNIKKIGQIIYLKSSFEKIMERLNASPNAKKKIAKRPLLANLKKAKELHNERDRAYEKVADFTIITENKSPNQITKEIIEILSKNSAKKSVTKKPVAKKFAPKISAKKSTKKLSKKDKN